MPCTKTLSMDLSKPVLVTRGNGYIAGVLISQLVEKGVTVHTTFPNPTDEVSIRFIRALRRNLKSGGSIRFFEDTPGSYFKAMAGCHAVFHVAEQNPADAECHVAETLLAHASVSSSVRQVVLTTQASSVLNDPVYKTARAIADSQSHWELATINPTMVIGPGVRYHPMEDSYQIVKALGCKEGKSSTARFGVPDLGVCCVDVRDVASAMIDAAYSHLSLTASYQWQVVNSTKTTFPKIAKAIANKYSREYPVVKGKIPYFVAKLIAPYKGEGVDWRSVSKSSTSKTGTKTLEVRDMDFIPMEQSVQEMYQQMIDVGVVNPVKIMKAGSLDETQTESEELSVRGRKFVLEVLLL